MQIKEVSLWVKASSSAWYKLFDFYMLKIGYSSCEYDCCVYVRYLDDHSTIFLLLYVDDMLIAERNIEDVDELKELLNEKFEIKDLWTAKKIIGIEICREKVLRDYDFLIRVIFIRL